MKAKQYITYLLAILLVLVIQNNSKYNQLKSQESQDSYMESFQDSLSDYGQWVPVNQNDVDPGYFDNTDNQDNSVITDNNDAQDYDNSSVSSDDNNSVDPDIIVEYIWVPNPQYINAGWNPYSNGRWIWTDWGLEWYSDYAWGNVTYHYGRWWYSDVYGWVWSPGYEWAPSWVDWCYSDGYSNGYEDGYYNGYVNGYDQGYENGNSFIGWHPISPREHAHRRRLAVDPYWVFVNKNNITKRVNQNTMVSSKSATQLLKNSVQIVNPTQITKKSIDPAPNVNIKNLQSKSNVQNNLKLASNVQKTKSVDTKSIQNLNSQKVVNNVSDQGNKNITLTKNTSNGNSTGKKINTTGVKNNSTVIKSRPDPGFGNNSGTKINTKANSNNSKSVVTEQNSNKPNVSNKGDNSTQVYNNSTGKMQTSKLNQESTVNSTPRTNVKQNVNSTSRVVESPKVNTTPKVVNTTPKVNTTSNVNSTPKVYSTPKVNSTPEMKSAPRVIETQRTNSTISVSNQKSKHNG